MREQRTWRCDARPLRGAPRSRPAARALARHAASDAARAASLRGRARPGNAGGNLQAQRNEDVGSRRRRPLRGVEAGNPDAVVAHAGIIVRIGQRHRRLDAGRRRSCVRGPDPPAWPRRRASGACGSQGPSAEYSSSKRMPAVHGLLFVAAQWTRAVPAELAQRREQARRPLGGRAARRRQRRERLAQARASAAAAALPDARSSNAASSSAPNSSFRPLRSTASIGGAGHHVVAIEKWHAQPAHHFVESQAAGEQPQTSAARAR